jgi:hypothetical protein
MTDPTQHADTELRAAEDHYCVFGWHHPASEGCDCGCSFCKAALIDGGDGDA